MTAKSRTDRRAQNGTGRRRGGAEHIVTAVGERLEDAADPREIRGRLSDPEPHERIPWEQVKRELGL